MGWFFDKPGAESHEGYLLAVVERDGFRWRELGNGTPEERAADELADRARKRGIEVRTLQVGCDCGWRSSRFVAPFGTFWSQIVLLPDHEVEADPQRKGLGREDCFEAFCRKRWIEHVNLECSHDDEDRRSQRGLVRRR